MTKVCVLRLNWMMHGHVLGSDANSGPCAKEPNHNLSLSLTLTPKGTFLIEYYRSDELYCIRLA